MAKSSKISGDTLSSAFMENCKDIAVDEASDLVVRCEQKIKEIELTRKEDAQLNAAKQIVKDLSIGYSSAIKNEKAKIKFLLDKIEEIESSDLDPINE